MSNDTVWLYVAIFSTDDILTSETDEVWKMAHDPKNRKVRLEVLEVPVMDNIRLSIMAAGMASIHCPSDMRGPGQRYLWKTDKMEQ